MAGEKDDVTDATGGCVVAIVAFAVGVFTYGFAAQMMWGWFVSPFGLPEVGLWHAIGLVAMARMVVNTAKVSKADKGESFLGSALTMLVANLIGPFLFLGVGYLLKLAM